MNEQTQAAPAANTLAARIVTRKLLCVEVDASPAQNAAHLLLSAVKPLVALDDDADVTLPAAALQHTPEELVNELHDMRAAILSTRVAASAEVRA